MLIQKSPFAVVSPTVASKPLLLVQKSNFGKITHEIENDTPFDNRTWFSLLIKSVRNTRATFKQYITTSKKVDLDLEGINSKDNPDRPNTENKAILVVNELSPSGFPLHSEKPSAIEKAIFSLFKTTWEHNRNLSIEKAFPETKA